MAERMKPQNCFKHSAPLLSGDRGLCEPVIKLSPPGSREGEGAPPGPALGGRDCQGGVFQERVSLLPSGSLHLSEVPLCPAQVGKG